VDATGDEKREGEKQLRGPSGILDAQARSYNFPVFFGEWPTYV
jgi:hypothetical protein